MGEFTILMKSKEVRFAILKSLSLGKEHGYGLYSHLKNEQDIKNPSEIYKVLRKMKNDGVIEVIEVEKQGKREREILGLSTLGMEEFYQELFNSSRYFLDLISETATRRLSEDIVTRFNDEELSYIFQYNSVFVDFYFPIERQLQMIDQIKKYFEHEPAFYIRLSEVNKNDPVVNKTTPGINFLDENMTLRVNSIDLIFLMKPITEDMFTHQDANLLSLLKKDGTLITATLRNDLRIFTPMIVDRIKNFFRDLFEEPIASKLHETMSKLLFTDLFYTKTVSNDEIDAIFHNYFKNVKRIEFEQEFYRPLFDLWVCTNIINGSD